MKRQAIKLIVHERYNPSDSYINDVALIKVYLIFNFYFYLAKWNIKQVNRYKLNIDSQIDPPFVFSELVQPVALPELHSKIRVNATAVVSGWGRLGGVNINRF